MSTDKKTKKKAAPKQGVGTVAVDALMAGKTNEEALAACQKAFPDAKTSLASINWYRNKLRAEGKKVPTARELKKKATKPASKKAGKKGGAKDPLE